MSKQLSERRLAENEVAFRNFNSQIEKNLTDINQQAVSEGRETVDVDRDMPLHFVCECSNEMCRDRIQLNINDYSRIHKQNDLFTIKCGHEIDSIESIVEKTDEYCVVEKHKEPPLTSNRPIVAVDQ